MLKIKKYLMVALALLLPSITLADLLPAQTTTAGGLGAAAGSVSSSIDPLLGPVVSLGNAQDENATTTENNTSVVVTANGRVVYDSKDAENENSGSLLNKYIGPLPYTTSPLMGSSLGAGSLGIGGIGGIGGVGGIGGIGGISGGVGGIGGFGGLGNPIMGLGTSGIIPLKAQLMLAGVL